MLACVLILGLGSCATQAEVRASAPSGAATLEGAWTVDLSTDPNSPYTKPMVLNLAADGTVTGSFYESEIIGGRWRADRGRTCVSFRTTDGVGPYHTAACLVGDHVEGQTWAEQRGFLFNWNAVRAVS
ncbi:MAG: hypothetical protein DCF16_19155 [Alphaproteobacteria bacterium]|nr:MAG: hypothetical protein DCF16_19155 [Alphaproteobacteria bacterium]